jgi:hypothetical protein
LARSLLGACSFARDFCKFFFFFIISFFVIFTFCSFVWLRPGYWETAETVAAGAPALARSLLVPVVLPEILVESKFFLPDVFLSTAVWVGSSPSGGDDSASEAGSFPE